MKKILVINGVNLNMLGIREPDKYGKKSYTDLVKYIKACAGELGLKVTVVQSNYEGKIVDMIQRAYKAYDGIIINAGAYTHTSVAILDALKAVDIPTVEVHLTNIYEREEFRHLSYVSMAAKKTVCGKGFDGYKEALEFFKE
ncbi:MAG: type II 3-dehydroquinate dehydratase [Clostridia bacterium]|nr:type II 3-dehydroquinate dehydratase [Clostridia bacterium]